MSVSPPADERRLIEDFLRGDREATRVFDGWIDVVLHQEAREFHEDWDDLRQEVRIRVFRNLSHGHFAGRSALRTYVHRIAKNVCIDFSRRDHRRRRLGAEAESESGPSTAVSVQTAIAATTSRDLLAKILDGLTGEDLSLLELVFVEHCSYSEVARRLSIPEGTVKSRMSRCKGRVLKRYRKLMETRGPNS